MTAASNSGVWEAVAIPVRKHVHPSGNRCILTNAGRWMREGQGISDFAECHDLNRAEVTR